MEIPCDDVPNWRVNGTSEFADITCQDIESQVEKWCDLLPGYFDPQFDGMIVTEACCACGGGIIYEPSFVEPLSLYSILTSSECIDEPEWFYATEQDGVKLGCDALAVNPEELCVAAESINLGGKPASLACCVSFVNFACIILKLKKSITLMEFFILGLRWWTEPVYETQFCSNTGSIVKSIFNSI